MNSGKRFLRILGIGCISFFICFSQAESVHADAKVDLPSLKCSEDPLDAAWRQIPSCKIFTPLGSGVGSDPLPYRENTDNSLIAIEGSPVPSDTALEVLTPLQCSNPRLLSDPLLINKNISYLLFKSGVKGICQIKISSKSQSKSSIIEMPINSWSVSVVIPPSVKFDRSPVTSDLKVGESIQIINPRFSYLGSSFDLSSVVPIRLKVETTNQCAVSDQLKILAQSSGICIIQLSWPAFAFGSRVYSSGSNSIKLFSAKTINEIKNEEIEKQKSEAARQQQSKADEKLCSARDQSKLKDAYKPLEASRKRTNELYERQNRINSLISQQGDQSLIMVGTSDPFYKALGTWPAIGVTGTRNVPLWAYSMAVQNARLAESEIYKRATTVAVKAYEKASKGCKKVVGKP